MIYNYHYEEQVRDYMIFVFGSNTAGRHGKGAAKDALKYGATPGKGYGISGRTYAIPTKDGQLNTLPIDAIKKSVDEFKAFAADHPDSTFYVTRIGCGLAGYTNDAIAPLFHGSPTNCIFPVQWKEYLK